MGDEQKFIDTFHNGMRALRANAAEMNDAARDLSAVGLDKMADRISSAAQEVRQIAEHLHRAYGDHISGKYQESVRGVADTLKTIIDMGARQ